MQTLEVASCLDECATHRCARADRMQARLLLPLWFLGVTFAPTAQAHTPDAVVYLVVVHLTLLVILVVLLAVWPIAWRRKIVVLVLYVVGLGAAVFLDSILIQQSSWIRLGSLFAIPTLAALIGVVVAKAVVHPPIQPDSEGGSRT